jgi:hypothetical protein
MMNNQYVIEPGECGQLLIMDKDSDELTAIALTNTDAQLVCDALNSFVRSFNPDCPLQ